MRNLRGRLDRLEKDMNSRPHTKLSLWDVLFAAPGTLDPDDPDVQTAIAWWEVQLARIPREVPDLIEAELAKDVIPPQAPGARTNGHLLNGVNGKGPDQGPGYGRGGDAP
jgi:hypothetical protein